MTAQGSVAIVTGAGRGIGAACARGLAALGHTVVVAARSRGQIEQVAAGIVAQGRAAHAVACDVTDEASVAALRQSAAALGQVAVLVNNAGAAASMPLARTTLDEWNRLLAVNATGAFLCTRSVLPGMLEQKRGRVVNVASIAGLQGARYISAYTAAKHALMGLTRAVAAEVAGSGVTVNAVCPGYVDTEMTTETLDRITAKTGRTRAEALAGALEAAGQRRLITAEEVADAVLKLAAEDGAVPNGEAVILDGSDAMSHRFQVVNPEELGAPRGWNNGMLARAGGRMLFIAGQTGVTGGRSDGRTVRHSGPDGATDSAEFVIQFEQALTSVLAVLRQAGGIPGDLGRLTIYVTDVAQYRASLKPLGEVYRRLMGMHYPAMALVEVKGLVNPEAVVEIEATAVV